MEGGSHRSSLDAPDLLFVGLRSRGGRANSGISDLTCVGDVELAIN